MKSRFWFILLLLGACDRSEEEAVVSHGDSAVLVTSSTADSGSPIRGIVAPTKFDPERVQIGDEFGSWRVVSVRRPPDDYIVSFIGQAELNGSYRPHFDYPEVKLPCFWVDPDSWPKMPRSQNDQRVIWFCFENADEAIKQIGPLGKETRATIVVDNYKTMLGESDVIDRARLVRVVRKEPVE